MVPIYSVQLLALYCCFLISSTAVVVVGLAHMCLEGHGPVLQQREVVVGMVNPPGSCLVLESCTRMSQGQTSSWSARGDEGHSRFFGECC